MNAINIFHITLEIWGSVFCLVAMLCVLIRKNMDSKERSFLLGLQIETVFLLAFDAMAWGFRGNTSGVGYVAVRLSNFIVYIMGFVISMNYTAYLQYDIQKRTGQPVRFRATIVYLLAAIGIVLSVVTQFTGFFYHFDAYNFYQRSDGFWLSQALGIVEEAIGLTIVLQFCRAFSKERFLSFLSYIAFPVIAMLLQLFIYGYSFLNIAISASVLFMFAVSLMEQEKYMNHLQTEVMMTQIGEHFIFNSLSTIKNLCETDPESAEEAVDEFAVYLRGNIDAIGRSDLIPFSRELEHVQNYLALEKRRFGKRLQEKYDIRTADFLLPALTLQPIVENAVKHGISKKAEGGTITIATRELKDYFEILVIDDGVGYDTNAKPTDSRRHVGMENVTSRLDAMCDGRIEVESQIDQGTRVRIFIKK